MISKADFYAFLILAFIYALWLGEQMRELRSDVKAIRDKLSQK
jgi:hypothetical protein